MLTLASWPKNHYKMFSVKQIMVLKFADYSTAFLRKVKMAHRDTPPGAIGAWGLL